MTKKKKPDKLAQDAAAANAAHMSYGQYKAQQVQLPPEPDPRLKACKYCGKLFKPRTTQVYCDINCQYMAKLDRQSKKEE
jgi:hypothetical protein